MKFTEKFINYIHGGHGLGMGTRDASMKPEYQRVLGASVVDDNHIKVFFDGPTARRIIPNLEENHMATVVSCSNTLESYQFKGKCIHVSEATEEELGIVKEYMEKFRVAMKGFGLFEDFVYQYPHSKMMTMLMEVTDIFEQTPKIGTGEKV